MDIDPSISAPPDLTEAQVIAWLAAKCRAVHPEAHSLSLHVYLDTSGPRTGFSAYFAHAGDACVESMTGYASIPAMLAAEVAAVAAKKAAQLAQPVAEVAS